MTTIKETLRIECPYVRAREYLHEALSAVSQSGAQRPLLLTAPLPFPNVELQKGVLVHYKPAVDPMHFDEPWYIGWDPEPGGVYPSFAGTLTVCADEDYTGAILEIQGSYAAPLGAAGEVFDRALGQKIARETLHALLTKIATEMTERYQREDSDKKRAV